MSQYICPTGSFSNTWLSPVEMTTPAAYASGSTFNPYVSFGYGSKFPNIRRNGTYPAWSNLGSTEVYLDNVSWNDSTKTATLTITVNGDYDINTIQTLNAIFFDFDQYPSSQPPDSFGHEVSLHVYVTGAGTPSGYTDKTVQFAYDPDIADFNAYRAYGSSQIRVAKVGYPNWTTMYAWQAYSDPYYTTPAADSFTSYVDTTYSVYVRYWKKAEYNGGVQGTPVNYGLVSWTDPRPDD